MAAYFTIPGRPVPKQRPRAGKNGNIYTPKNCREYEKAVGRAAREVFVNPYDGPVELQVKIYLASKGGDLDNYIKAISDGLNGIAWRDDSQVSRIKADLVVHKGVTERAEVLVKTRKRGA
ncbi:MAG TPA: RusA family crossover junction endodeoxyribonuclease [Bacillota bacterium]|nr:RusA family crossover junction endodeoxyribonuclease [Bacillota bacterium]